MAVQSHVANEHDNKTYNRLKMPYSIGYHTSSYNSAVNVWQQCDEFTVRALNTSKLQKELKKVRENRLNLGFYPEHEQKALQEVLTNNQEVISGLNSKIRFDETERVK